MTRPTNEEQSLAALTARLAELETEVAELRRRKQQTRRTGLAALLTLTVSLVGASVAYAATGACPNGLPYCFQPDTPAVASQINQDLATLKEWVEMKAGSIDAGSVIDRRVRISTPTGNPLFVTGALAPGDTNSGGVEFRHDNDTQGIGIGYSTLYATGNWNAQPLQLKAQPGGTINLLSPTVVSGNLTANGNGWDTSSYYSGEANFSAASGSLNWHMCNNGQYVCGVGHGHVPNDNNYWSGARLQIRCCSL